MCTRSPCGPKIASTWAGPSTAPIQCGVQVENSAASPGLEHVAMPTRSATSCWLGPRSVRSSRRLPFVLQQSKLRSMDFEYDCIVVGAGPAGLSAALTLGRARRDVLVLDSGAPRNYAAREMHGVLGHDGLDPAELRRRGVDEIARYGIAVRDADVGDARVVDGGVEIGGHRARAVILATGLLDAVPDIDGFDAIYGISAHTCPYCDGWEHRDTRIAVYATAPEAREHLGLLLRQWSADVVVLDEPVERFVHDDGRLTAVEFGDDREPLARDALFFHAGMTPRTALAAALGCELNDGGYIVADAGDRQTSVDRVYAVGNCVEPMHNVPMAIADGALAAVRLNFRLVEEGVFSGSSPVLSAKSQ